MSRSAGSAAVGLGGDEAGQQRARRYAEEAGTDKAQSFVRSAAPQQVVPRQLPAAVAHFSGRAHELATFTGLVRERSGTAGTVVISHLGLHLLAEQLRDTQDRWQALTGDDPSTDVQEVFSWSYHALAPDAAPQAARDAWQQALTILDDLHPPRRRPTPH